MTSRRAPFARLSRILVGSVALILTLAIAWDVGLFSVDWRAWFKQKERPVAQVPERLTTKPIGLPPPVPLGNDTSISPTPLPLLLVSTAPGRSPQEGSARIGVIRESPQTYQAGALLENGARLAEIHADYVLLQKGPENTRLYLEGSPQSRRFNYSSLVEVGGTNKTLRTVNITNRETLTDYIRPAPLFEGQEIVGYQVYPGARRGPFSAMGLKAGDIVVALDGVPLSDAETAWSSFRRLAEGNVVLASIKRNNETAQLKLDGGLIAQAEEAPPAPPPPPL